MPPAASPESAQGEAALAARAQHLIVGYEPCQYTASEYKCRRRPYSAADPEGYIELSYAENKVVGDILEERLGSLETARTDFEYADEWYGSNEFREAVSPFLNERLGYNSTPMSIVAMGGTSTVIEAAVAAICDEGDVALCLAPHYSNFSKILSYRNRVALEPVYPQEDDGDTGSSSSYEGYGSYEAPLADALARLRAAGRRPRLVMISNPSNPAGVLASPEELAPVLALCAREDLHCLVDEIYALSVHDPSVRFVSACRVAEGLGREAAARTHVVYGFSKDFAASGLRVGVLHSLHYSLLLVLQQVARLASPSTLSQRAVLRLLRGPDVDAWLDRYLETLRGRLRAACGALAEGLQAAGIPFVRPHAGLFVMMQAGEFLPLAIAYARRNLKVPVAEEPSGAQAEDLLYKYFMEELRVNLTPGGPTRARPPGWFRVCVAQDAENVRELTRRLGRLAARLRSPGGLESLSSAKGAFFAAP